MKSFIRLLATRSQTNYTIDRDPEEVSRVIIALNTVIVVLLAWIAVIDMRQLIIPDRLTVLVGVCAAALSFMAGASAMLYAALGALVAFLLFDGTRRVMSWRLGRDAMGFGDVKLMSAGGLWIGLDDLPTAILIACITAGMAFFILSRIKGEVTRDREMPFGPFIAIGLIGAKGLSVFLL